MLLIFITISVCLANTFCSSDGMICITGNENAFDYRQTCFTVSSKAQGWVGFGIGGQGMDGSDMYVGYKNSTGGYSISNLLGMGHGLRPSDMQNTIPTALTTSSHTIKDFAYSFCRNNDFGGEVYPTQRYIYAYSSRAPFQNIDSPFAPLEMHDDFGFFEADFTGFSDKFSTEEDTLSARLSFKKVVIIHGIIMWFAWGLLPFVGIFIARYMKDNSWWFMSHAIIGSTILLLTMFGFVLMLFYQKKHFNNFHSAGGLLMVIMVLGQVILGMIIHSKFDKNRFSIPYRDQVHWWIGRFLMVFGLVTIQTGFNEYSEEIASVSIWLVAGHYIMVVLGITALLLGEYQIGPKHHVQEKPRDYDLKERIDELWKRKAVTDKEIQDIRYRNASAGLEKEMAELGFDVDDTDSSGYGDEDFTKNYAMTPPDSIPVENIESRNLQPEITNIQDPARESHLTQDPRLEVQDSGSNNDSIHSFHPIEVDLPPRSSLSENPADFEIHVAEEYDEENFELEEIGHVESQEVIRYSGYHRNFDAF